MVLWLDPMRPALLRDRHAHFDGSIRLPAYLSLVDDAEFPGGAVSLVGHGEAVWPPGCSWSRLTTHIEAPLAQEPNFGDAAVPRMVRITQGTSGGAAQRPRKPSAAVQVSAQIVAKATAR